MGIVVVSDLGNLEFLLILLGKLTELLLFANSWSADKMWSGSRAAFFYGESNDQLLILDCVFAEVKSIWVFNSFK